MARPDGFSTASGSAQIAFGPFVLDGANRRLLRDGQPIDLTPRYFDALHLMVTRPGVLISKDAFNEAVWHGMAVTDEALTQCIRSLRQALGDKAASPRFIETVPKHGYRFIAAVGQSEVTQSQPAALPRDICLRLTIGGAAAGLVGGAIYGLAGALQPGDGGSGSFSALIVMAVLDLAIGLLAGAGIGTGLAVARAKVGETPSWRWIAGGALAGLAIGTFGKLVIVDALVLLIGRSAGDVTGGGEGLVLGAGLGAIVAWLDHRRRRSGLPAAEKAAILAAALGALVGALIITFGGTLMAGSLALLAQNFATSHLRPAELGALFGEGSFGPRTALGTGALESAVLYGFLVFSLLIERRSR